jgi:hypothetical protein
MPVFATLLPHGAALVPAGGFLPAGPAGAGPATVITTVAGAAPAGPALAAGIVDGAPPAETVLRLVLLTALAVVAGTGLVRVLSGPAGRAERVVAGVAALAAVSAAVAAVTWSGAGTSSWTLGLVAVTVAVPALLWTSRPVLAVVPAVAVTVLLVMQLAAGSPGSVPYLLDAGYAVAGALLAGAVVHLFTTRTAGATGAADTVDGESGTARPGRVRVLALVAGVAATVLAAVRIAVSGPFALVDLPGTGYGRAAAVTLIAPAAVVALVLAETLVSRRAGPSARERVRAAAVRERGRGLAAVAAVAGIGAATLLAALPAPAPAAVPGQALLRGLDLGSGPLTLAVAPMRPGPNLVQLTGEDVEITGGEGAAAMPGHDGDAAPAGYVVRAGDREVPFVQRPGAPGGWALVDVPAGTGSITVSDGAVSRSVPVDVGDERSAPEGSAGADGPECLSAVLGRITAGGDPTVGTCPSETLDPADEQALRATVRSLAGSGVPGVARPTALGGIYLAPWLLTGGVLAYTPGVLLPLDFGPQEEVPQRYVRSLSVVAPGSSPSVAGLRAWAAESGVRFDEPPALYGAAPVSVPMTSGDDDHHQPNTAAWFPGGAVVRIGGPLDTAPPAPTP